MLAESVEEGRTGRGFRGFGFFYFYGVHFLCEGVFGVACISIGREGRITLLRRNVSLPELGFARNLGRAQDCNVLVQVKEGIDGEGSKADRRDYEGYLVIADLESLR